MPWAAVLISFDSSVLIATNFACDCRISTQLNQLKPNQDGSICYLTISNCAIQWMVVVFFAGDVHMEIDNEAKIHCQTPMEPKLISKHQKDNLFRWIKCFLFVSPSVRLASIIIRSFAHTHHYGTIHETKLNPLRIDHKLPTQFYCSLEFTHVIVFLFCLFSLERMKKKKVAHSGRVCAPLVYR